MSTTSSLPPLEETVSPSRPQKDGHRWGALVPGTFSHCLIIKTDISSTIEVKCSSMSVQNTWQGSMLTTQHKSIHSLECGYLQTPRGDSEFLLQYSELQHLPEAFD